MDRERQTLELLQLLGDDVAEAVLERLQPERADKLRASLKSDKPHLSTIGRQREVLDEFECFFQFALKSRPPEPASPAEPDQSDESVPSSEEGSPSTTENSAKSPSEAGGSLESSSLGRSSSGDAASAGNAADGSVINASAPDSADSAPQSELNKLESDQEETMVTSSVESENQMTGDPLRDLQALSIHQVALALASEQARTTAILLSNLPAKLTGDVLNLLKPDYQKLVMKELTKEQHAPAVLVERIARATFIRAQQLPPDAPDTRDHADRVAEVLRSVPKAGRRNMLAAIEEQDPELAKSLLTRIYRFDDIASLSKAVVQRVLGEVDSTNLTTALFGAEDEVKDAIFANLSKRARQTIEEEMQFMTNVAESRITQARNAIAEVIAKIDMESES
jgi:flagellar motor switch protein FliG